VRQSEPRLIDSATYLAEHMHDVPVLIIPCVEAPLVQGTGPGAYASILPATWSLMLALRARGVSMDDPPSTIRAGSSSSLRHPIAHSSSSLAPRGVLHWGGLQTNETCACTGADVLEWVRADDAGALLRRMYLIRRHYESASSLCDPNADDGKRLERSRTGSATCSPAPVIAAVAVQQGSNISS